MTRTMRQLRVYLHPDDLQRLRAASSSPGRLLRTLASEALVARGLPPLITLHVGYPKGRKRR